ncbi:hypothetical protein ZIOFF_000553 [Zingiber officinale]|uniref:Uncharacterized protein n=1 Tax=Zingiber officinale TaxID=94328 RepID=A0A8J5LXY2_ZINOF|nr:hypothetical protein ZIOFF_005073 [Zingiber officinale]KAG6535531.1 hypothetical protein ZIOFF_000553 [Zingiber officinale]
MEQPMRNEFYQCYPRNLTIVYTENRPLTKQEVHKLVAEIAEQPKLIEKEALKLTEELSSQQEARASGDITPET